MKKLFAALIATSVLATSFSVAEARDNRYPAQQHHVDKRVVNKKVVIEKRTVVHKHRWSKGNKLTRAERRQIINARDYRRHHLHAPRRGEQWVRVDNQFLLISAATGLIVGLVAVN
jgi:Ni/Co efflux regulator RcnB